jgi:hypothetical protein
LGNVIADLPEDIRQHIKPKKAIIENKIIAEAENLLSLEIDEGFLQREVILSNKQAELTLGANQAQQKAIKKYIAYLLEKWRENK